MTLLTLIDAMFLKTLANNRARSSLLTVGDAFSDAAYRFSIVLAAPALAAISWLLVLVGRIAPNLLSRSSTAILIAVALIVTNVAAYLYVTRRHSKYRTPSYGDLRVEKESNMSIRLAWIFGFACIPAYAVAMAVL